MDLPAHLAWTAIARAVVNRKYRLNLKLKQTVFWGVFPDLFAFLPGVLLIAVMLAAGMINSSELQEPRPGATHNSPTFNSIHVLYSFSHSLIVFTIVFLLVRLYFKRTPLELGGWLFHILVDIPTHSFKFYPTPFLWPLSNYRFDGFTWWEPSFMIANYTAIAVAYLLLKKTEKKTAGAV